MNALKMIRTLEQLSDRMVDHWPDVSIHRMRAIEGNYKWWCRFDYENKYGGTVEYSCSDVSLDKALAGLLDKLDAAGLLGDE